MISNEYILKVGVLKEFQFKQFSIYKYLNLAKKVK